MSLMFFISGLFVWPALKAKGARIFLRDRLLRLGLPFAAGVVFLMPIAYYPSWLAAGGAPGYLKFWPPLHPEGRVVSRAPVVHLAAPAFRRGRIRHLLAAALERPRICRSVGDEGFPDTVPRILLRLCSDARPLRLRDLDPPLSLPHCGFSWQGFSSESTWFIAGIRIGSSRIKDGILAENGLLARHWPWWISACAIAYNLLVFVPGIVKNLRASRQAHDLTYVTLWVLSCCASCFGLLALFRGAMTKRRAWMDSMARSAYLMYIVHYVYVTWAQYFLLGMAAPAGIKFCVTFGLAVGASWLSASLLRRVPRLGAVL